VNLLVTFRENLHLTPLPALNERVRRTDPSNQTQLIAIANAIEVIKAERDSAFRADSTDLVNHLGAGIQHRHWLTHSLLVTLPLSSLDSLAARSNVIYVQPEVGIEGPPRCPAAGRPPDNGSPIDDPVTARGLMQTDSFRNLGFGYGNVSLIDTGVWTGHALFTGVTFGVAGDCVHGDVDCVHTSNPGFDTSDQCLLGGHGTASAGILAGGSTLGPSWLGALSLTLDYFQVYDKGTNCGGNCGLCLNADAAEDAMEAALANGNRVIVANFVSQTPDRAAVGMSAINAFDLGAVVVAANGNASTAGSVQSPASASCVIGVGSQDIRSSGATETSESRGPASGNRIKPDIQALTGIETAQTQDPGCTRTDVLNNLTGTSGATPYAGAAAALLRNWMKVESNTVPPGYVNAAMILCGRHYSPNLNNTEGAGMIELPTDGCAWWSFALAQTGKVWEVPIDLSLVDADSIEAAVWWPEHPAVTGDGTGVTRHNELGLYLVDPDGTERASSHNPGSVFERATALINKKGVWKLQIQGYNFYDPSIFQDAFWIAAARKKR
jgi:hypothetical protein